MALVRAEALRRRRAAAVGGAIVLALLVWGVVSLLGGSDNSTSKARADARQPAELPRGGREIFPRYRVVAFYGAPQDAELGTLGIGSPRAMARRLERQARPYAAGGRPVLPAMELIADVASYAPGDDGLYRTRQSDRVIRRYLNAARQARALLILDIQPGHAGFLTEARHLEKWLRMPDVSLALDPEWHTPPGVVPGQAFGSVDAMEVNAVSFWLDALTRKAELPQKLLVVHRFTENMITNESRLKPRRSVAVTLNVDGFGTNVVKVAKYKTFAKPRRSLLHNGFKLFYKEDVSTMRPERVLRIRPRPELVVYE